MAPRNGKACRQYADRQGVTAMTRTELPTAGHAYATPPFDYGRLDPETADTARNAADRIRELGLQQNEAIFTIGRELHEMKQTLRHGNFGPWLRAEFNMSVKTAERYIGVAETLPEKIVIVTNLKPTTLYCVSAKSTPARVREEIITRIERGETLTDQDIRRVISDGKATRATAQPAAGQVETQHPMGLTSGECQQEPEASRLVHMQAVLKMLAEAFDLARLLELVGHLVGAGWGDPLADLICKIKQRCSGFRAERDAGATGVPMGAIEDSGSSGTGMPTGTPDPIPKPHPAAHPATVPPAPAEPDHGAAGTPLAASAPPDPAAMPIEPGATLDTPTPPPTSLMDSAAPELQHTYCEAVLGGNYTASPEDDPNPAAQFEQTPPEFSEPGGDDEDDPTEPAREPQQTNPGASPDAVEATAPGVDAAPALAAPPAPDTGLKLPENAGSETTANSATVAAADANQEDALPGRIPTNGPDLIAVFDGLQRNTQTWARWWVLNDAPAVDTDQENPRTKECRDLFLHAHRVASPDRRAALREYLEARDEAGAERRAA
jgi:hypothetical protein